MKASAIRSLGLLLLLGICAAPEQGLAAGDLGDEGTWKPLVAVLASKGPIRAGFTERRFFTFRKQPTVLRGVIRISPDLGLSLEYTEPDPMILIVDAAGIIVRDRAGRDRQVPAGSREVGAIASLLPVLRFDVGALSANFDMRAEGDPSGWSFEFTPKDRAMAQTLGTIIVRGVATDVTAIEFRRSATQRIEIEVGETAAGVVFKPAEIRRCFRQRAPR
jgi:hypothetical protein